VRLTNALTFQNSRIARKARRERASYLNLGSGPRGLPKNEWINIDGFNAPNVHCRLDFNRPLPFPDDSFEGIFCEHVIEHFDLAQGLALLGECFRVLRPGGFLRIIVPDGETILKTYCENPAYLVARRGNGIGFAMDAVNSYFRQRYEHQFIYDWPLLEHQLNSLGFAVERVNYREGNASRPIMLDDEKYAWESLYAEAVKPLSSH
jgi:predicted SAM-dependent methyltransferase